MDHRPPSSVQAPWHAHIKCLYYNYQYSDCGLHFQHYLTQHWVKCTKSTLSRVWCNHHSSTVFFPEWRHGWLLTSWHWPLWWQASTLAGLWSLHNNNFKCVLALLYWLHNYYTLECIHITFPMQGLSGGDSNHIEKWSQACKVQAILIPA